MTSDSPRLAAVLLDEARRIGIGIGVAESLTGGLVTAALTAVPGASAHVRGGITAYATPVKHTLLGVDAALLAERGAVDADVAMQMARGVRSALAIAGAPCELGLATTGVAGPAPQDGRPVGTVFVAAALVDRVVVDALRLDGSRELIRERSVAAVLAIGIRALRECRV